MIAVYCFLSDEEYALIAPSVERPGILLIPLSCEDWNRDLSPWPARRVFSAGSDFSGGADAFLLELTTKVIPQKEKALGIEPEKRYIAGYSLAGLFALYAALETELFDGAASVSGSLWFDGFAEYIRLKEINRRIKRVCFSVGDKEKNAREPRMKTVEDRTREIAAILAGKGVGTVFELNPGGHFTDVAQRLTKGLLQLTRV